MHSTAVIVEWKFPVWLAKDIRFRPNDGHRTVFRRRTLEEVDPQFSLIPGPANAL